MIIPVERLSAEAVQGLIEEFITREGTDYGEVEISLADKVEQIRGQLARGEVVIVFDAVLESVSIKTLPEATLAEREYQQQLDGGAGYTPRPKPVSGKPASDKPAAADDWMFNQDVHDDDF